jgi:hypothetical protein
MSVAEEKPAVDAILLKVLEAVPFELTTDGGVEASRQRFRADSRRCGRRCMRHEHIGFRRYRVHLGSIDLSVVRTTGRENFKRGVAAFLAKINDLAASR